MPHRGGVSIFCPSTTLRPGQLAAVYDLRCVRLLVSLSQAGTLYSCSPRCRNFLNANTPQAEINPIRRLFFFRRAPSPPAVSYIHMPPISIKQAFCQKQCLNWLQQRALHFPPPPLVFIVHLWLQNSRKLPPLSAFFFSSLCWSAPGGRRDECAFNKRQLPQWQLFQAMQSCNYS